MMILFILLLIGMVLVLTSQPDVDDPEMNGYLNYLLYEAKKRNDDEG